MFKLQKLKNKLRITLSEMCPNTEFFLVHMFCILSKYKEIWNISPYSVWMKENTDQKILRIWTLFTECYLQKKKSKKSSLASSKSRQRNYLQAEQFEAQQREGRLEEKVNYCEREYEATTTKLQRKFRKKDLL